jgi:hypothetical protein
MRQVEGMKEVKEGFRRRGGRRKGESRDADPPYFSLCGDWQVLTNGSFANWQCLCRMAISM